MTASQQLSSHPPLVVTSSHPLSACSPITTLMVLSMSLSITTSIISLIFLLCFCRCFFLNAAVHCHVPTPMSFPCFTCTAVTTTYPLLIIIVQLHNIISLCIHPLLVLSPLSLLVMVSLVMPPMCCHPLLLLSPSFCSVIYSTTPL